MNRIILGGAQLSGWPYNAAPPLSRAQAFEILDAAWAAGIRAFDTAEDYGAGAARLEEWLFQRRHKARITTKVTLGRGISSRAYGARTRFSRQHDVLVYTHGFMGAEAGWEAERGHFDGQSVYTIAESVTMASLNGVDRIQLPWSSFHIDIPCPADVRSVFSGGKDVYDPVYQIKQALGKLRPDDRLVIGVSSPMQVSAIVRAVQA